MNASVDILTQLSNTEHEYVQICRDEATGLRAIIAVHSTEAGPALGAIRMQHYASEQEALAEVLRLARSATFRAALAGRQYGGGAAVVIGDSSAPEKPAMLRSFARFVHDLGGKFVVTEDRGIATSDLEIIREVTPHVACIHGENGDPAPFVAFSVFISIATAMKRLTGSEDLYGRKVLVQGVGRVGLALVRRLCQAGATVYACDIRDSALRAAVCAGARAVPMSAMHSLVVDVYAPCAVGAVLTPATIPQLRCAIVAGAADNPLLDVQRDGQALHDRGILYVPDFVANAGGLIAIASATSEGHNPALAIQVARNIRRTVNDVLDASSASEISPHQAAVHQAKMSLRAGNPGERVRSRTQFRYSRTSPSPRKAVSDIPLVVPPGCFAFLRSIVPRHNS